MTANNPEERSDRIGGCLFAIMGNSLPPRDPDEENDDEDEEGEEELHTAWRPSILRFHARLRERLTKKSAQTGKQALERMACQRSMFARPSP